MERHDEPGPARGVPRRGDAPDRRRRTAGDPPAVRPLRADRRALALGRAYRSRRGPAHPGTGRPPGGDGDDSRRAHCHRPDRRPGPVGRRPAHRVRHAAVDQRLIRCTLVDMDAFQVAVPDEVLADLAARLRRSRRPPGQTGPDGPPGGQPHEDPGTLARIDELIGRWGDGYDWRALERRINAVPQYRVTVDGVRLHVLQVPGAGPDPLPLLLLNGWPSSIVEYLDVLPRLTDPAAYGGDPADSFTVVVPAMPGYGFSDRCLDRQPTRRWIAGLFHRLMTDHLGHIRYVAHGDDIGGGVVNRLGLLAPPGVLALSTANPIQPHLDAALSPAEQSYADAMARWEADHGAYAHVQATRPRTLAAALHDSPAGLAAWIL